MWFLITETKSVFEYYIQNNRTRSCDSRFIVVSIKKYLNYTCTLCKKRILHCMGGGASMVYAEHYQCDFFF